MKSTNILALARLIDVSKPVEVYRNLTKECFSVRQNEKVVAHIDEIFLKDVEFVVRPGGRQKVLETKQKNVHAFVKGRLTLQPSEINYPPLWSEVTYNPYKMGSFYDLHTEELIGSASLVWMSNGKNVKYIL